MAILAPITSQSQEQKSQIMQLTEYTIKFGQNLNFTDGVKKWNKCYKDNKGTDTWNVWHRLQGQGNIYVLAGSIENWAAMDKEDAAGKACRSIALESIIPYIESSEFNVASSMPAISKKEGLGENTIVWVTYFTVNDDTVFNDIVKDVTSTISSKDASRSSHWYKIMGGQSAHYFVSTPYKNFAALDVEEDGVWKIYESVHGKSKTSDIRTKFRAAVKDMWSYTFTLDAELSMQ